jgi:hypothetical protein
MNMKTSETTRRVRNLVIAVMDDKHNISPEGEQAFKKGEILWDTNNVESNEKSPMFVEGKGFRMDPGPYVTYVPFDCVKHIRQVIEVETISTVTDEEEISYKA